MALTQAAVLGLAGVLLMTPVFATAPIRNHAGLAPWIYAGMLVLFLVQTLLNLKLWLRGDEFLRKMILIVSAATFAVSQGALFLWAAAERLGLVQGVSSWDLFTLLMATYMAMSFAVSIRMRR
jgi:hypothetical protein